MRLEKSVQVLIWGFLITLYMYTAYTDTNAFGDSIFFPVFGLGKGMLGGLGRTLVRNLAFAHHRAVPNV